MTDITLPPHTHTGWSSPQVFLSLCVLFGWVCGAATVTWVRVEHIKSGVIALALDEAAHASAIHLLWAGLGLMTPVDIVLLALVFLLSAAMIALEASGAAFTRILSSRGGVFICAGSLLVAWLGHSYFGRGYLVSGDTIAHIAMLTSKARAIAEGQSSYWSNLSYFGLPLPEYYSPTTFWPLTALDLAIGNPSLALRIFFAATYVLSALAAVGLARQLGLAPLAALIVAMSYSGSFAHLHLLLYRGAVPQALSMVFLPLVFMFIHRVLTRPGPVARDLSGLALSAAGLLANYTPLAILACVYLFPFVLGIWAFRRAPFARIGVLTAAGAMAGLLAAFVLLPGAAGHSAVRPMQIGEWLFFEMPGADYFNQLLIWRAWRTDHGGGAAYLGLSVVCLAAFAWWRSWRSLRGFRAKRPAPEHSLALGLGLLLIISFFARGLHVRDIVFTLLFVSLLAGLGATQLLQSGRLGRAGPAILVGIVFVDLGSTAIQPIGRSDKSYLDVAGTYLERQSPQTRIMEGIVTGATLKMGGPGILAWHEVEAVNAGHAEMASPAWVFGDIAETLVGQELNRSGHLSDRTTALLCLLRVGRIVGDSRTRMGMPANIGQAQDDGVLGRVVKPGCGYQVIFAPSLRAADASGIDPMMRYNNDHSAPLLPAFSAFFDKYYADLQLDPATGVAAAIPVVSGALPTGPSDAGSLAAVAVGDYAVSTARVTADLWVSTPGFIRLSQAANPDLRIRRNGSEVAGYQDPMGFVVVPVVAGENRIEIAPQTPAAQLLGNRISLAALLLLPLFALLASRRGRQLPKRDRAARPGLGGVEAAPVPQGYRSRNAAHQP